MFTGNWVKLPRHEWANSIPCRYLLTRNWIFLFMGAFPWIRNKTDPRTPQTEVLALGWLILVGGLSKLYCCCCGDCEKDVWRERESNRGGISGEAGARHFRWRLLVYGSSVKSGASKVYIRLLKRAYSGSKEERGGSEKSRCQKEEISRVLILLDYTGI